jgi:hypothetical protein
MNLLQTYISFHQSGDKYAASILLRFFDVYNALETSPE